MSAFCMSDSHMERPEPAGADDVRGSKAALRRADLLSTARQIVRQGGFRALQMNDVAAAAGIAVGTIYRSYPSKSALCAALVSEVSTGELARLEQLAGSDRSVPHRIFACVEDFCARAARSNRLAYAMIAEPVDPEVETMRLEYRARIAECFKGLLRAGLADGTVSVADPEGAATCIVGAFMEAVIALQDLPAAERATRIAQTARFCVAAVTTPAAEGVFAAAPTPTKRRTRKSETGS